MLTQWKLNGVFDQLAGVVLGQFRKCIPEEPEWSFSLEQVFEQHFKDAKFPVFSGFLCGHILDKFTLPVGQTVEMDATQFSIRPLASSVRFL
jgi:muramoyltetrapeptide carboxypeptidase